MREADRDDCRRGAGTARRIEAVPEPQSDGSVHVSLSSSMATHKADHQGWKDRRAAHCSVTLFLLQQRCSEHPESPGDWRAARCSTLAATVHRFRGFYSKASPIGLTVSVEYDPVFGTDRLASGILEFEKGTSVFTCSTQMAPFQRVNIFGTEGRIELEIPFNASPDRPSRIWLQTVSGIEEITFDVLRSIHNPGRSVLACRDQRNTRPDAARGCSGEHEGD